MAASGSLEFPEPAAIFALDHVPIRHFQTGKLI